MRRGADGIQASLMAQHSRLRPGEAPWRFQGAVCCGPFAGGVSSVMGHVPWKSLLICLPRRLSQGMEQSQDPSSDLNEPVVVIRELMRFDPNPPGSIGLRISTSPNPADAVCAKCQIFIFFNPVE